MNKKDILTLNKIAYAIKTAETKSSVMEFFSERCRFKNNIVFVDTFLAGFAGASAVSGGLAASAAKASGFAKLTAFLKGAAFGANAWLAVVGIGLGLCYLGGRLAFTEWVSKRLSRKDMVRLNDAIDRVRLSAEDLLKSTEDILARETFSVSDSDSELVKFIADGLRDGLLCLETQGFTYFQEHRMYIDAVLHT
ncbi:D-3-phosphoglycerate dehydrogenase [Vibrio phage vB_VmeM-Yong XC32]|nr:D-3-phosphoglycerate dehydrogenase [Vibrio phage vB_VmeM-Yong XC31]QAX96432.1 D-3-phosphoglycerate dehydrogenase [Vibrio phage vB_VmeM-Yong XC32]QAX96749.1 D-3-phosphoglycerate dehydrogenase [Vibrio phage vB_VmeM-Yong MS31]QAX97068.1 D-3-phosphoglycerate dehydrogenase [Vibrio phage vB_VmeM-Yong MS32]